MFLFSSWAALLCCRRGGGGGLVGLFWERVTRREERMLVLVWRGAVKLEVLGLGVI